MGGADGSKKGSRGRTTTLADRAAAQHLSALGGRSPHPSQPQQNALLAAAKSEQVVYPPTEATIATMEAAPQLEGLSDEPGCFSRKKRANRRFCGFLPFGSCLAPPRSKFEWIESEIEVTLLKPSAETSWGVMPGTDTRGHVLVHALSPLGTAKEQLQVGDRIRAIDGTRVRNETDFVTRLNGAFERANGTQGPTLALTRALPVHSRANKPAAKAAVSAPAPAQTPPARPATLSSEAAAPESQSPRVGGVQAEFVWIGVTGELRCKTKRLQAAPKTLEDLELWNLALDTQAPSEVLLKPCAIYPDPFRSGENVLVLCDCYTPDPSKPDGIGDAISTNTRAACKSVMDKVANAEPWFGIEQEYSLFGEPTLASPMLPPTGPAAPTNSANAGRQVAEAHLLSCKHAGIVISALVDDPPPGGWKYKVGPCTGIESLDQLVMSRYVLIRVAEKFSVAVSFGRACAIHASRGQPTPPPPAT